MSENGSGHAIRTWGGRGPYTAGSKAPWRGDWGPIGDYHSRLGRLARKIELQLASEYDVSRPLWASRVREAAELKALAQRARDLLGIDPKATLRSVTAATMAAERLLNKVPQSGARPMTPDELLDRVNEARRQAHQEAEVGGR